MALFLTQSVISYLLGKFHLPSDAPATASISGNVFIDANHDGQDNDGQILTGARVDLKTTDGELIATTYTDGDGNYSFGYLPEGDYQIDFQAGPYSPLKDAGDPATDNDANTYGYTDVLHVSAGQQVTNIDAGVIRDSGTAELNGTVFWDKDENGLNDDGANGVEGIFVKLEDANGNVIATTYTDADGFYSFPNLAAGQYNIDVDGGPYTIQDVDGNSFPDIDSDVNSHGRVGPINLSESEVRPVDAGVLREASDASISGNVFVDVDLDGQDNDGVIVAGATVNLELEGDRTVIATTTTDENGNYTFTDLPAGNYIVDFQTGPYTPLVDQGDPTTDNDADSYGRTQVLNISASQQVTNIDAGVMPASISGNVFVDANLDGQDNDAVVVEGALVQLEDPLGNVLAETRTDADGNYTFEGLAPGDYRIDFQTGPYTDKDVGDDATDSDVTFSGTSDTFSVGVGEDVTNIDAGVMPATVEGTIFIDRDEDGQDNDADNALEGATVNLEDPLGNVIATTTTDANGNYSFEGLAPGDYRVDVEAGPYTARDVGDDSSDSDVGATGVSDTFTLGVGATVTIDAGVLRTPQINDDTALVDEDDTVTIDVLANDTDPNGDDLTITEATVTVGEGTVDIVNNQLVFTPAPDFNGPVEISYTAEDPSGEEGSGTVAVNVAPVNDAPVAENDTDTTEQGTPVTLTPLTNDSDTDGDPLTIIAATVPADQGSVTFTDDEIVFTPAPAFVGDAEITYTISDGNGLTDVATITVAVTDVLGPVDGLDTSDNMGPGYTDAEGDEIDGADGLDDTIFGNGGDDIINSGAGDDVVEGGDGDDTIILTGGLDNDQIVGGESDEDGPGDTIDASNLTEDLEVQFINTEEGSIFDGEDTTNFEEIENVETGSGNDTILGGDALGPINVATNEGEDNITGSDQDDSIDAGDDNDIVDGGDGDDVIDGGAGDDDITGGDGNDTVTDLAGNNTIDTSGGDDLPDQEFGAYGPFPAVSADSDPNDDVDVVTTGDGNDTITTGDDNDVIDAGNGNNVIDAGLDDDTITTGDGDDVIVGGEGEDTIGSGGGDDTIFGGLDPSTLPSGVDGADIPDAPDGGTFGPDPDEENGRDVINAGAGNDTVFGQDDDDIINGGSGDDFLDGGIDDDTIDGGTGDDTIIGGHGQDAMSGGDGEDTFIIDTAGDGIGDTVDGGSGGAVVADNTAAPNEDWDVLDLRGSAPEGGSLKVTETGADSNGNGVDGFVTFYDANDQEVGRLDFTEIENVIPCFTPGTMISTPRGEVKVEDLQVGDRVITRDNGIQEIRWVGQRIMTGAELERAAHLKPVLIRQGALGKGMPERDMMVSPNHRVLISNFKTSLYFDEGEVLVAAKHLTDLDGVDIVDVSQTIYIHVMFDQHEVILSDGAWTESFQPGDMTLGSMGSAQRKEIFELFPELKTQEGIQAYTAARRSLKRYEAKLLTM